MASGIFLILTLLAAASILLNSLALSGEQVADRNLGRADASLDVMSLPPGSPLSHDKELLQLMRNLGARDLTIRLRALNIQVDGVRTAGLATGASHTIAYEESLFGDASSRYVLRGGRWPQAQGEVAISASLAQVLGEPHTLSLFAGLARYHVVGTFTDVYATRSLKVIGYPGNWSGLPAQVGERFSASAGVALRWSQAPSDAVISGVAQITGDDPETLVVGLEERRTLAGQRPLTERGIGLLNGPAIVLSCAASLLFASRATPPLLRQSAALQRLGVLRRRTIKAAATTLAAMSAASALAGAGFGCLVAAVARPLILSPLVDHPLSPWVWPTHVIVTATITSVAATLANLLLQARELPSRSGPDRHRRNWRSVRVPGALALVAAGFRLSAATVDLPGTLAGGICLTLASALLVPEIVSVALHMLPSRPLAVFISRNLMAAARKRLISLCLVLMLGLALPTNLLVLVTSQYYSAASESVIPAGQLRLNNPAGFALPQADIVSALEESAHLPKAILLAPIGSLNGVVNLPTTATGVFSVETVQDIEGIFGCHIDHSRTHIESGAIVILAEKSPSSTVIETDSGAHLRVDAIACGSHTPWSYRVGAVWLHSAAASHGITLHREGYLVYTHVTDEQVAAVVSTLRQLHQNPQIADYHKEPPPPELPWDWATIAVIMLLTALASTFAVARSLGSDLRHHVAQFKALGLPQRNLREVVASELAFISLLMAPLVTASALVPSYLLSKLRSKFEIHLPPVLVLGFGALLATTLLIATLGAVSGVRSNERQAGGTV